MQETPRKKSFATIRFDKKMDLFVTLSIIAVSLILFFSTIVLLQRNTLREAMEMESQRLSALAMNIWDDLDSYKKMAVALNLSEALQQYTKMDIDADTLVYFRNASLLSDTLRFICQLEQKINFISVYSNQMDDYLYQGNIGLGGKDFKLKLEESYSQSLRFGKGAARMDYTDSFTTKGQPAVNFFFPVYSATRVDQQEGMLCISIDNRNLSGLLLGQVNKEKTISIIDDQGNVIVTSMANPEPAWSSSLDSVTEESGRVEKAGMLYLYEQIPNSRLYLVQEIGDFTIGAELIRIFLIIFLIMVVLIFLSLWMSRKLVKTAYAPMETVLQAMHQVGDCEMLELRIDGTCFGEDFVQIAQGFNTMMNEITLLIARVEQERKLKEKMRYYALQTQITPHFLYNTLECIHWQALADGNKKISSLVMALGSFYKISLSEGKDMISLEMELEHVRNYLFIQNMRYGDIIKSSISVDESLYSIPIPRITLQPLVENAISHGIRVKQGNTGMVSIMAFVQKDVLCLEVADTGGITDAELKKMNRSIEMVTDNYGFGIRNVHQRIKLGFGSGYGLSFFRNEEDGLTVTIRLPLSGGINSV